MIADKTPAYEDAPALQVATRLREFRARHNLTQLRLALLLGLTPQTVTRWETRRGGRVDNPRLVNLALDGLEQELGQELSAE